MEERYQLQLYVAGKLYKNNKAINNLQKYCEKHLEGRYTIEVIDLLENPHLAEGQQIIATPTLIKRLPEPVRILIGDLSNEVKFLVGMNLKKSDT